MHCDKIILEGRMTYLTSGLGAHEGQKMVRDEGVLRNKVGGTLGEWEGFAGRRTCPSYPEYSCIEKGNKTYCIRKLLITCVMYSIYSNSKFELHF